MTLPVFMYRDVFPHREGLGLVGMVGPNIAQRPNWYTVACYVLPRAANSTTGWEQRWRFDAPVVPNTTPARRYNIVGLRGWAAPDGRVCCACALSVPKKPDKFAYYLQGATAWQFPGVGCAAMWPCLVWHDGTDFVLLVQDTATTYRRFRLGQPMVQTPMAQTSMGFRQQLVDGTWTMGADPRGGYLRDTSNGVTLLNVMKLQGVWIGQNNARTEGIVDATGERFVVSTVEGHDPRFAYDPEGDRFVASSWAPGSGNLTVTWQGDRLPAWLPPPEPPAQPARLIWRGLNGYASDGTLERQPGNFAWGQPADARPVLEGMPWASAVGGTLLLIYIGTEADTDPYPDRGAQIAAVVEEARRRQCAVGVYSDAPTWTAAAEKIADTVEAQSLVVVRVVQAYLTKDETPTQAVARVKKEVQRVESRSQVGLMQRADRTVSTAEALEQFTAKCEELIAAEDAIVVQAVFGVCRPNAVPEVIDDLTRTIRAMPAGRPPPLVTSTPPEPPTRPLPEPKFFPRGRSYVMDDQLIARGTTLTVGWDSTVHQPIVRYLRNPPGDPVVYVDREAPGAHEEILLTRMSADKCYVKFTASANILCVTPERVIETRPPDHTPQIMEAFEDVRLPSGDEVLIHTSGLVFYVER